MSESFRKPRYKSKELIPMMWIRGHVCSLQYQYEEPRQLFPKCHRARGGEIRWGIFKKYSLLISGHSTLSFSWWRDPLVAAISWWLSRFTKFILQAFPYFLLLMVYGRFLKIFFYATTFANFTFYFMFYFSITSDVRRILMGLFANFMSSWENVLN